jgi:hypothetical protein
MIPKFKISLGVFLMIFVTIGVFYSRRLSEKNQKLVVLTERISNTTNSSSENIFPVDRTWVKQLSDRELKVYSQNGEDGVLLWIFANIGTANHPPRFVEFGTESGIQCNTRFLRHHVGWQGLMMDGGNDIPAINLHKEMISAKNINDLLAKYQTPVLLDILSIDVE